MNHKSDFKKAQKKMKEDQQKYALTVAPKPARTIRRDKLYTRTSNKAFVRDERKRELHTENVEKKNEKNTHE